MSDFDDVINWRRLNERITTSGQPTEEQLRQIKALGVAAIVNLGPHTNKGALPAETASVKALGVEYVYIPVDFEAPSDEDFAAFCAAMDRLKTDKVHVHCIYNARVSAFFYRYAMEGLGGDAQDMFDTMDGIWRPGGVWAIFIGKPEDQGYANRYEGYDY